MVWIHIVAGVLSIVAGGVALYASKGQALHRRSGLVFAVAMLTMTATAVVVATYQRPNPGNVVAATLTFYLVVTGVLAVRRSVAEARAVLIGMMIVAFVVGAAAVALATQAMQRPNGAIDGVPTFAFIMFASVALGTALADVRMLVAGQIQGRQRLGRHLWRMGYAMWIATTSLFLGQADEFPASIRSSGVLVVPILWVTGVLLYWLVRVRFARQPLPAPPRKTVGGRTALTSTSSVGELG